MAGGVIAAVAGPWIGAVARDWFAPVAFAGSYAAVSVLSLGALALLIGLDLPRPVAAEVKGERRPWPEIARQPAFVAALANSALGYAVMIFVMTATPLAALACALSVDQAASIIQWHLVGMFAPAFLAGPLIGRIGVTRVMLLGTGLIAVGACIALSGLALEQFWLSLFLNGIGWNFLYVGGTTLMTTVPRPAERARVQGTGEFIIFGATAAGSLAAGVAYQSLGWQAVNLIALGLLIPTVAATLWHGLEARRAVAV
jgi:MFS family permease